MDLQEDAFEGFINWVVTNQELLLTSFFIIVGAWLLHRFGMIAFARVIRKTIKKHHHKASPHAEKQREDTIIQIVSGVLNVVVWPMAFMAILSQIGIDIAPLIAGAGVVGVALGFGAQTLVKDLIAGLFIIVENQYRVGDVVEIVDTAGVVEGITLRVTILRDLDGVVHHVPNGSIEVTSNMSKDFSGINLNVGVAYDSDLNKVIKIINNVGEGMAQDQDWQEKIIEAPSFLRVDQLGDSSIMVKVTGKVHPLTQWEVTGEMRKRIKEAFDKEGIEIPFPQRVIHQAR